MLITCGFFSACFFLDLRKAFDTIDHSILLRKLEHIGFRGHPNDYIESYIRGRRQYLQIGDMKSDELLITKGVPQGSVLGPLLFCLYIDDIVKAVDVEVVLFDDDAAFIIIASTLPQLYEKINKLFSDLQRYLIANRLVPNLAKSKLMCFSSQVIPLLQDMKFGDEVIEWVNEYKYLGLTVSNKMTYNAHIENVANQISRFSGIFWNLRMILPRYIMKTIYFSFILPHVLLHIEIWGSSPDSHLHKLKVRVNSLLRIILRVQFVNGRPLMSNSLLYKTLGILNVDNLYKLRMFKLLILLLRGELPNFYDVLLRPYEINHNYATRGGCFRNPLVRNEIERRAASPQLILLHESITNDSYRNVSIARAVKNFKNNLLENQ